MKKCDFEECDEKIFENNSSCILHIKLPDDIDGDEFKRINELKENRVKKRLIKEILTLQEQFCLNLV